jgi:hypothetical protein
MAAGGMGELFEGTKRLGGRALQQAWMRLQHVEIERHNAVVEELGLREPGADLRTILHVLADRFADGGHVAVPLSPL